jgi:ferric-dicitrate binding protein FerR (iron transport regulator)
MGVLFCTQFAAAQIAGDTARVLLQNGRVSVEQSGDLWALAPGQTVNSGQVLVTGADGYAQLQLSDQSIIEVFPNSRLVFHPSRGNWKDLVDIFLGKIRLQIQHLTDGDSPYHVNSPTAVISIRGTVLDVEVEPTEITTVQVETGLVSVRHRMFPGKEVNVGTGQTLRVMPNIPLAALKGTPALVIAGRIARVAGETVARIGTSAGKTAGSSGSSKGGGGGSAPSGGTDGSTAGTNQPAPPPGQDNGGKQQGNNAPPGDVIKP